MRAEQILALRPHHALCLLLFCAEGHSARYAGKMRALIGQIERGEITGIRMIAALDEICGYCPHNENGLCAKEDEVLRSDARILALCGLTVGESISWAELKQRLVETIITQNALAHVCDGCTYLKRCEGKGATHSPTRR